MSHDHRPAKDVDRHFVTGHIDQPLPLPPTPASLLAMDVYNLPEDVLVEILSWLQPRLPVDFADEAMQEPTNGASYDRFRKDQLLVGNLRLVCRDMNSTVTAFFYEEILVYLASPPSIDGLNTLFSFGGKFIRTLVIDGRYYKRAYHNQSWHWSRNRPHRPDITQAIGEGLAECSQLRRLDALGDHGLFPTRKWLKNPSTKLSKLTSLVYNSRSGVGLSHCLVSLGPHLRSLTIQGENHDSFLPRDAGTFHLPTAFPNLEYLRLDGGLHSNDQLRKLFSRIKSNEIRPTHSSPHNKTSRLRCLVVTGYSFSDPPSLIDGSALLIRDVLPAKTNLDLTTLHFLPNHLINTRLPSLPIPTTRNVPMHIIMRTITKACPNLEELSIPCSQFCDAMDCIPPKLKHLSVFVEQRQAAARILMQHGQSLTNGAEARPRLLTLLIMSAEDALVERLEPPFQNREIGIQVEISSHPYLKRPRHGIKITYLSDSNS